MFRFIARHIHHHRHAYILAVLNRCMQQAQYEAEQRALAEVRAS